MMVETARWFKYKLPASLPDVSVLLPGDGVLSVNDRIVVRFGEAIIGSEFSVCSLTPLSFPKRLSLFAWFKEEHLSLKCPQSSAAASQRYGKNFYHLPNRKHCLIPGLCASCCFRSILVLFSHCKHHIWKTKVICCNKRQGCWQTNCCLFSNISCAWAADGLHSEIHKDQNVTRIQIDGLSLGK